MFRVLSEEEAGKVTRWKAPELDGTTAARAKTTEWTSPIISAVGKPQRPVSTEIINHLLDSEAVSSALRSRATSGASSSSPKSLSVANPSLDIVQTSYDDGYAKGYSEGNAALHQQAVKELRDVINAIGQSTGDAQDYSLHQEVAGLSIDIARIILAREVQVNSDAMLQLVKAGLEQLPSMAAGSSRVHLHPLDANVVRENIELSDVQVVDDLALKRGHCRISTNTSTLECGIDQWLEGMARQLGIVDADSESGEFDSAAASPQ